MTETVAVNWYLVNVVFVSLVMGSAYMLLVMWLNHHPRYAPPATWLLLVEVMAGEGLVLATAAALGGIEAARVGFYAALIYGIPMGVGCTWMAIKGQAERDERQDAQR